MPLETARRPPADASVQAEKLVQVRSGFTLVELLVVIAIIGVLVALLLPAVQAAREAARRSTCQNNLKQLVYGIHLFESANKEFPAAIEPGYTGGPNNRNDPNTTNRLHSWVPYILPYIEQQAVFQQYRFDRHWSHPTTNGQLTGFNQETTIDVPQWTCPTTPRLQKGRLDYAAIVGPATGGQSGYTDHTGQTYPHVWHSGSSTNSVPGAWSLGILIAVPGDSGDPNNRPNKRIKIAQVTDGTSKSVLLGECAGRDIYDPTPDLTDAGDATMFWANGDHAFAHHWPIFNDTPRDELYSDHPGGLHLGMADASVRYFSESGSKKIIDALATRAGEEPESQYEF